MSMTSTLTPAREVLTWYNNLSMPLISLPPASGTERTPTCWLPDLPGIGSSLYEV